VTPPTTSAGNSDLLSRRHRPSADSASLYTIASAVFRERHPLVFAVRNRIVAKVDSVGFVVCRWCQCAAGKS
jgi:hypothetical protein